MAGGKKTKPDTIERDSEKKERNTIKKILKESDDNLCGTCNKANNPLNKNSPNKAIHWLECTSCERWLHATCEKITPNQYEAINSLGNRIKWICSNCDKTKEEESRSCDKTKEEESSKPSSPTNNEYIIKAMENMEKRLLEKYEEIINNTLQQKFKEFESKAFGNIKKLEEKIATLERIIDKKEDLKKDYQNSSQTQHKSYMEEEMQETIAEMKRKEERRCSLIIYGLKETDENGNPTNVQEWVNQIISKNEPQTDIEIKAFQRIGRNETPGKIRPLQITVGNRSMWIEMLKLNRKCEKSEAAEFSGIAPDRTYKEREERRKMMQELWQRRKEGGNWRIYRNKIIKIDENENTTEQPSKEGSSNQQ